MKKVSLFGAEPMLTLTDLQLEQEKVITEIRVKDQELSEKFKVFSTVRMEGIV